MKRFAYLVVFFCFISTAGLVIAEEVKLQRAVPFGMLNTTAFSNSNMEKDLEHVSS